MEAVSMKKNKAIPIQHLIYKIRRQKVMLDSDLASLYDVELRALNQATKRNIGRFPSDFMFQLTQREWNFLRSQIVISKTIQGGRRYVPFVFTEQGISMLSSVLNSEHAVEVNINIMRAFVKLRHFVDTQIEKNEQIAELRKLLMLHFENNNYKFSEHDKAIGQIINALNNLIKKPKKTITIGFNTGKS